MGIFRTLTSLANESFDYIGWWRLANFKHQQNMTLIAFRWNSLNGIRRTIALCLSPLSPSLSLSLSHTDAHLCTLGHSSIQCCSVHCKLYYCREMQSLKINPKNVLHSSNFLLQYHYVNIYNSREMSLFPLIICHFFTLALR